MVTVLSGLLYTIALLHVERTHVVTATVRIDEQGPHQNYCQNWLFFERSSAQIVLRSGSCYQTSYPIPMKSYETELLDAGCHY